MSLVVENVSKTYRSGTWNIKEFKALKGVSFSLESGKVLALLGQNGAGKTTLIKCILNFLRIDSGDITMCGKSIETLIKNSEVGYMPEKLQLPKQVTIKEYISDLMILRGKKVSEYDDKLDTYIKKFYMEKHVQKKLEHYSKGTAKKAAFIQAIIHEPALLILDEPTDGLDPVSRRALLDEINELKRSGHTILISTHLLSDISIVADKAIVLQNGSIIQQSNLNELQDSLDDWYLNVILEHGGMAS